MLVSTFNCTGSVTLNSNQSGPCALHKALNPSVSLTLSALACSSFRLVPHHGWYSDGCSTTSPASWPSGPVHCHTPRTARPGVLACCGTPCAGGISGSTTARSMSDPSRGPELPVDGSVVDTIGEYLQDSWASQGGMQCLWVPLPMLNRWHRVQKHWVRSGLNTHQLGVTHTQRVHDTKMGLAPAQHTSQLLFHTHPVVHGSDPC